ncbi:MAG: imidazole glycerol phosphate synthase subunit HisH [Fluviicola sp.]|jgi:glutamine amidotransferase
MEVVIIDYGAGNLFSVQKAFERIGVQVKTSSDFDVISSADKIIFPGVGHAKAAMDQLKQSKLDALIPSLKQPVLGICLGMQLLCESTDEGNTKGLGIFNTKVQRFNDSTLVPQMGWNDVEFKSSVTNQSKLSGAYYFVHSYRAELCSQTIGVCDYQNPFSAVLQQDNFLACQFHPEKSGVLGEQFLQTFLAQ